VNTGRGDTLLVGTGSGDALLVNAGSGDALLVETSGWCSVSGLATDGSGTDRAVLLRVVGGEDAATSSGTDGRLLAAVKVGDLVFTVGNVVVMLNNQQRPKAIR
jgi:hypothetical protein